MIMSNLIKAVLTVAALTALSASAEAKRYCCSNPAICNAVCGSSCCGSNLAAKAQTQDKMSKPVLKTAAPTRKN
jgi:hypothetical protein